MLVELERYENLGTPGYFWELLKMLDEKTEHWTVENIRQYFFNRIVDGKPVFDGCLPFAQSLGIIKIDDQNVVYIDQNFAEFLMSE